MNFFRTLIARFPILCLTVGTFLISADVSAQQSAYPVRSIRLVVPYTAGGTTDVIARVTAGAISKSIGQQIVIDTASAPLIHAGALRGIAVASTKRSGILPDLPTMSEAGLRGFEAYTWNVLLAPKATPRDVVDYLNREVDRALSSNEVRARLAEFGVEMERASTPESTRKFMREEAI